MKTLRKSKIVLNYNQIKQIKFKKLKSKIKNFRDMKVNLLYMTKKLIFQKKKVKNFIINLMIKQSKLMDQQIKMKRINNTERKFICFFKNLQNKIIMPNNNRVN